MVKHCGFCWSKRRWVAVASAGSYASLHFAPDRYPCHHPTTQFFTDIIGISRLIDWWRWSPPWPKLTAHSELSSLGRLKEASAPRSSDWRGRSSLSRLTAHPELSSVGMSWVAGCDWRRGSPAWPRLTAHPELSSRQVERSINDTGSWLIWSVITTKTNCTPRAVLCREAARSISATG